MNTEIRHFIEDCCARRITLALAESMTCGLASHQLSTSPGTSEIFRGGIVCYSPLVKTGLLRVPKKLIDRHTAESMEVTVALAKGLKKLIEADVHAAITGLASPDGSETRQKPSGTVFFCVTYKNRVFKQKRLFRGTPLQIRKKAAAAIFELIGKKILA